MALPQRNASDLGPHAATPDQIVVDAWSFAPEVYRVLRHITRNCSEMDDLAQEVYLSLLEWARRARNTVINPEMLVKQIARNRAIDWYRAQRAAFVEYVDETEIESVIDVDDDVEGAVNAEQEFNELMRALQTLPERTRQAYVMRKIWGWSQKDIAQHLEITENTVEALITKGSRRLREYALAFGRSHAHATPNPFLERALRRRPDA